MSIAGKNTLSIRKTDIKEQKNLAIGFKKTYFAHKATLGDTGITLSSLSTPTEMSSLGFVNPSAAEIAAAQLYFYRKNFTLISSLRGVLMDFISYNVSSSNRIDFNGFTAADGEIFIGIVDYNTRSGINVVDAADWTASGTLAIGSTDFNTGTAFELNKYPGQQVGAALVFRNGLQQFRNSGNSSSVLDGNYYEVNNGSGMSNVIRFNSAPVSAADNILVISNGIVTYSPDGSALQQIETLAGQIDSIVPTVAALAGVPESNFQTAPNNVDLKSFGDIVLGTLNLPVPVVTDWVNGGPIAFTAPPAGVAPTKGNATIAVDEIWWRRVGGNMELRMEYRQTAAGTATAGTGDYLFLIPGGYSIDLTKVTALGGATIGSNVFAIVNNIVGNCMMSGNGAGVEITGSVHVYDANNVRLSGILTQVAGNNSAQYMAGSTGTPLTLANQQFVAHYSVPIAGWGATQTLREYLQSQGINV